ncbi:hypothetical protein BDN72DRAFT_751496, partial [Pluteus cervinus]
LIARCRSKVWILQLHQEKGGGNAQRGMKGHIIVYPQRPNGLAEILPPPVDEIVNPVCVIFVGSTRPTNEWLKAHAKPLCVRSDRIRKALRWLKENNHLYHDVVIDEDRIQALPDNDMLPINLEVTSDIEGMEAPTAPTHVDDSIEVPSSVSETSEFHSLVVADVETHASVKEQQIAALGHVFEKGKSFIQVPHSTLPESEFYNTNLFPCMYPTLFPYGVGGFEDASREQNVSMQSHAKH